MISWRCLRLGCLLSTALVLLFSRPIPAEEGPQKIHIGVCEDLFSDTPKQTAEASAEPFRKLMEQRTGYTGDVVTLKTPFELAKQLDQKRVQLGVFEGFQFAWVKPQHADLKPLVIAVNQQQEPRAYVVVPKNSPTKGIADLKGKVLDEPLATKGYVRLFVQRLTEKLGKTPEKFFAKIDRPGNIEDALDDAVDGQVPAVACDSVAFEAFQKRKPGRASGLRVLARSPQFPAVVVAYRDGVFDQATLERFRRALLNAADNSDGRRVLTLWKLSAFETVPTNYPEQLRAIRQAYPAPK